MIVDMKCLLCGNSGTLRTDLKISSFLCETHYLLTKEAEKNSDAYFRVRNRIKKSQKEAVSSEHIKKNRTRYATRVMITKGAIEVTPCEVCGDPKVEVHHITYEEADNIRFLCKKHHHSVHFPHLARK